MAVEPKHEYTAGYNEALKFPRIGSIEHIAACAKTAGESSITTAEQLQEFLQAYNVPESLAYFIFDYQTRSTRRFWTPKRSAIIDTRGLPAYMPEWPVFQAEYHYQPRLDRNFLHVYGRPAPNEKPHFNLAYSLQIPLKPSLELDTQSSLEAYAYLGAHQDPIETRVFRTIADSQEPLYAQERDPSTFVFALQETAEGLTRYLYLRDYL